jgi:mycothiol synthase
VIVRAPVEDDLKEVFVLVTASDRALLGDSDWTEDDLRREWHDLDLAHDAWVLELGDRIGGYATFDDRGGGRLIAEGYVHPELLGRGVGSELIRLTEERAVAEIPQYAAAPRVYLQNATADASDCTAGLYATRGYAPSRYHFRMVADLGVEPAMTSVRGIEIRGYRPGEEERAVHEVIEDAFAERPDTRRRSFEEWSQRVFDEPGFDPTLCWVAVSDGAVVGANVSAWKRNGDWGWIDSIGVLPEWRGRGIGEALLRTAFAEFWRRGECRVALGVDADNAAATRLYERAGMQVFYTVILYEKELRGRDQAS